MILLINEQCSMLMLTIVRNKLFDTVFMEMSLEALDMEFMRKAVSLRWIWIPTNDYTAHADLIDIHKGN